MKETVENKPSKPYKFIYWCLVTNGNMLEFMETEQPDLLFFDFHSKPFPIW